MEDIFSKVLLAKNSINYLLIFFCIIAILTIISSDKFRFKFSSNNLIKEKDIDRLEHSLVINRERELVKNLIKIKFVDFLVLIFAIPFAIGGWAMLKGALIGDNDVFMHLFVGLSFIFIACLFAKKLINSCLEKIILAQKSIPIYKIEVLKCDSHIKKADPVDRPSWIFYYYICVKSKNDNEIKKWYEVDENVFNENNLFLYYFKILNKNHIILVPKKTIEEKLNT